MGSKARRTNAGFVLLFLLLLSPVLLSSGEDGTEGFIEIVYPRKQRIPARQIQGSRYDIEESDQQLLIRLGCSGPCRIGGVGCSHKLVVERRSVTGESRQSSFDMESLLPSLPGSGPLSGPKGLGSLRKIEILESSRHWWGRCGPRILSLPLPRDWLDETSASWQLEQKEEIFVALIAAYDREWIDIDSDATTFWWPPRDRKPNLLISFGPEGLAAYVALRPLILRMSQQIGNIMLACHSSLIPYFLELYPESSGVQALEFQIEDEVCQEIQIALELGQTEVMLLGRQKQSPLESCLIAQHRDLIHEPGVPQRNLSWIDEMILEAGFSPEDILTQPGSWTKGLGEDIKTANFEFQEFLQVSNSSTTGTAHAFVWEEPNQRCSVRRDLIPVNLSLCQRFPGFRDGAVWFRYQQLVESAEELHIMHGAFALWVSSLDLRRVKRKVLHVCQGDGGMARQIFGKMLWEVSEGNIPQVESMSGAAVMDILGHSSHGDFQDMFVQGYDLCDDNYQWWKEASVEERAQCFSAMLSVVQEPEQSLYSEVPTSWLTGRIVVTTAPGDAFAHRRSNMLQLLAELRLPVYFFDRVGRNMVAEGGILESCRPVRPGEEQLSDAYFANGINHLYLILNGLVSGIEHLLIFEDDIYIANDFGSPERAREVLEEIWEELPLDYDFIFLGACCEIRSDNVPSSRVGRWLWSTTRASRCSGVLVFVNCPPLQYDHPWGTGSNAYLLSRSGMMKMLLQVPMWCSIDWMMHASKFATFNSSLQTKVYFVEPPLFVEGSKTGRMTSTV